MRRNTTFGNVKSKPGGAFYERTTPYSSHTQCGWLEKEHKKERRKHYEAH
jgi:hypothetical protein